MKKKKKPSMSYEQTEMSNNEQMGIPRSTLKMYSVVHKYLDSEAMSNRDKDLYKPAYIRQEHWRIPHLNKQ